MYQKYPHTSVEIIISSILKKVFPNHRTIKYFSLLHFAGYQTIEFLICIFLKYIALAPLTHDESRYVKYVTETHIYVLKCAGVLIQPLNIKYNFCSRVACLTIDFCNI